MRMTTLSQLRAWRIQTGLSMLEMSRLLGVSRNYLTELERGARASQQLLAAIETITEGMITAKVMEDDYARAKRRQKDATRKQKSAVADLVPAEISE
jgi:transcriptional regulator with XRE-family HTH domain